jgi:hypothetical protein
VSLIEFCFTGSVIFCIYVTIFLKQNLKEPLTCISGLELKQLVGHLTKSPNICFRFRLLGEMWMKNLMQVTTVNDKTVLCYDDVVTKYYLVKINNIMQFEIDARFHAFQPFFHYEVKPSPELD